MILHNFFLIRQQFAEFPWTNDDIRGMYCLHFSWIIWAICKIFVLRSMMIGNNSVMSQTLEVVTHSPENERLHVVQARPVYFLKRKLRLNHVIVYQRAQQVIASATLNKESAWYEMCVIRLNMNEQKLLCKRERYSRDVYTGVRIGFADRSSRYLYLLHYQRMFSMQTAPTEENRDSIEYRRNCVSAINCQFLFHPAKCH